MMRDDDCDALLPPRACAFSQAPRHLPSTVLLSSDDYVADDARRHRTPEPPLPFAAALSLEDNNASPARLPEVFPARRC